MRSKDRLAELALRAGEAREAGGVYCDTVELAAPAALPAGIQDVLHEAARLRGWILQLEGNTQLLRRLHADPTFHTNKQIQEQLDSVITQSNALGLKVCGALRQLEPAAARARRDAAGRIARLQYAAARAQYGAALAAHHAALAAARDHRLQLLHHQLRLTNLAISDDECQSLLDSNNISLFVDNVGAETAEARRALREVEARHEELTRLEGSLRDVGDLFQQLAVLVAAQQEQVDSVEYFALQASEHVELGGQELLKGSVIRAGARKKKISLLICVAAGLAVVVLVLVVT